MDVVRIVKHIKPSKKPIVKEKPVKAVVVEPAKKKTTEKKGVLRKKVAAARKSLVGLREKNGRMCKTIKIEKLLGLGYSIKVVARAMKVPSDRVAYVAAP